MHPNALEPRAFLRSLFDAAVAAALPDAATIAPFLPAPPTGRTLVLGAGKAGGSMAAARRGRLAGRGTALRPRRHPLRPPAAGVRGPAERGSTRIEVVEAAHPVPDEAGRRAAARILALARRPGPRRPGALPDLRRRARRCSPCRPTGVSLDDKQAINSALLKSGAAIDEMNCVRKHLSAIKGGRLARACAPARVVTLLVSDVPGDAPAIIGSGPTVPDPTTCADALAVLDRYAHRGVAGGARAARERRARDAQARRRRLRRPPAAHHRHAAAVARGRRRRGARGRHRGAHPRRRDRGRVTRGRQGACARWRGRSRAAASRSRGRACVLSGGETTVTVPPGRGRARRPGRASSCSAAPSPCRARRRCMCWPPTPTASTAARTNAGAFVAPDTLARAAALGASAARPSRPQRRLRLLRRPRRPRRHRADVHQRQRLQGVAGSLKPPSASRRCAGLRRLAELRSCVPSSKIGGSMFLKRKRLGYGPVAA